MATRTRAETRSRARVTTVAACVALGVALAGCGDGATDTGATSTAEESAQDVTVHNDADTQFAQMMIDHHEDAVRMAQDELAEGENVDALALAQTIVDDQTAQITTMQDMLAEP